MRRSIIQSVFHKELTDLLRNRRSLLVMFGVPLLLYPVLTIAVASLTQSKQDSMTSRTAVVVLVNGGSAPKLHELFNAEGSGAHAILAATAPEALHLLATGSVDAVIEPPKHFQADAIAGKSVELGVNVDRSRETTASVEAKVNKILAQYNDWIIQQRLLAHGLAPSLADPPTHTYHDIATATQTFGAFLSYTLPVLLLTTGMLGTFYPGLSATTTERELGTLETLLATPATRDELLIAKAAIVLFSGLLTALLNMVSMSLVFWRVMSSMAKHPAGLSIDPMALTLSYLASVPTLIFFTALVLMVGMLARNLREANAYGTPLMMLPIASMLVGIANPAMTPALLVTPVANTTLIIRAVLTGQASFGAFALAFVSSGLFAGLMLSLCGRVFSNEQLVNPAWEPVSLRGLGRRADRPRRWPAMDEAIALFAVSLLLNFYISPSWAKLGLIPLLVGVEILLIAGPAIVFAWFGRYPIREVFSLRPPPIPAMVGGLLLGLGLIPLANGLVWLQNWLHILPYNASDMEGYFAPTLQAHPVLAPIVIGLLAGVCEELLFRGPIQAALLRRLPVGMALTCGGLLFAAIHMDLPGMPARTGLGIVLGWIVWRSGAIWPAMLMHAVYDGVQLAWVARAQDVTPDTGGDWKWVVAGVVLCAAGIMATKVAKPRKI
ncbi:MAG TPA: ABC transporter permease subunit/CPBP intramembrane protease [Tepidisphaeraceae bacterium]|nr:ABC transporter permease subunit/CPBP intramembrane protease [Tepidisphaeraceae bacterium]